MLRRYRTQPIERICERIIGAVNPATDGAAAAAAGQTGERHVAFCLELSSHQDSNQYGIAVTRHLFRNLSEEPLFPGAVNPTDPTAVAPVAQPQGMLPQFPMNSLLLAIRRFHTVCSLLLRYNLN